MGILCFSCSVKRFGYLCQGGRMSKCSGQDRPMMAPIRGSISDSVMESLLEKCLLKIDEAKSCMQREKSPNQSHAITKAIDILAYLQSCLRSDTEDAKKNYNLLSAMYINAEHMLIKANTTQDLSYLNNAHSLISGMRSERRHKENA